MGIMSVFNVAFRVIGFSAVAYVAFLTLLSFPYFQGHIIYLHRVTLTWFMDVNVPEQWGFLRNQVTPFKLQTSDQETLHAWHILPLELYRRNEQKLLSEPAGLVADITSRLSFKLLRDDPEALLVIYLHGAAGTLGSGWRPQSYRGISAAAPDKIHIVAIDYRGFGTSTGVPSEEGLLRDALTLTDWAMNDAGIPSSRIVVFGQSLGTAVSISLVHHLALRPTPILFSGMVLVAPYADVETLTATYRVAGTIPILSPVAYFPALLKFLNGFIVSKWPSKIKLADMIRYCESMEGSELKYHVTLIHAEDDYDIPWIHSEQLYWHAINGTRSKSLSFKELEREKANTKTELGEGGWMVEQWTNSGVIREQIIKYGLHDRTMSYPVVSLAIMRAFHSAEDHASATPLR